MKGWSRARKMFWVLVLLMLAGLLVAWAMNGWVHARAQPYVVTVEQVQPAQVAIVPGALVYNKTGGLSPVLQDRVDTAIQLYKAGKVERLLMSGDHGDPTYDEVNSMRAYAVRHGVPDDHIFTDHAGFNTYDTMARARRVFLVEKAVVVTNGFHLDRSVFLARQAGILAQGVAADRHQLTDLDNSYNQQREFMARCKAVLNVYLFRPDPMFLGEPIPINGDARLSHDDALGSPEK
ncbi:MAG: ElyC/SanA/YdcF family protein [Vulcanimicrobiota bacterium]